MIAEISYHPGTERTSSLILRSPKQTIGNYLDMDIKINTKKTMCLLAWYLKTNPARRTADRVQMWTSEEDAAAHPRDLNLFGGLKYDERFHNEKHEKKPFVDPFPTETTWRDANGLEFILWHIKFILCNADGDAYAYLMQWFGYMLQRRCEPRVVVCFYGAPGCGNQRSLARTAVGQASLRESMDRIIRKCRRSSKY